MAGTTARSMWPPGAGAPALEAWARSASEAVPAIVAALREAGTRRIHRDVLGLVERPLLAHALALTGGNQLHAARLLGLNRNTLRKRCRDLGLAATSRPRRRPTVSTSA